MNKLTKVDIQNILSKRFEKDECTKLEELPKPNCFKDMDKASSRIVSAIKNDEKIAIVGDYDVDGVVSSVILSTFFDDIGVEYEAIIPNRFQDGYGLSLNIIKKLDATVIITVDNGISAVDSAQYCKEHGIDLIITDHHSIPSIVPDAYAIVNPKQTDCQFPNCEICGAQVAWYLTASIKGKLKIKYDLSSFLDILCIAIMADMMELKDMNRVMVKKGILALNRSKRPAFEAVKKFFSKKTLESDEISFLIAPLINSSGRMEDAKFSYNFLKSQNIDDAMDRLEYIVSLNNSRKDEEKQLFEASLSYVKEDENIIIAWGEDWHEGVLGIVASRLSKRFKKPAIVFSITDDKAKGSARGIGELDILALITLQQDILLGFGGHKGAAGVSLMADKLEEFRDRMYASTRDIEASTLNANHDVLGEIEPSEIDFELLEILEEFEPYGQKNPKPNFILKDIAVKINKKIGKDQNHLKLILHDGVNTLESIFFNFDKDAKVGEKIDILFTLSRNDYRGLVTPQLIIKEIL
ncbi:single-stranded-DNA-specific exonuclease RecJ [Sulfurospirillum sp. 1612]|uniref:single-stranded-DNA-specific exonuclease RecJ n=1 Tax=Sulfurospirillum sp. 1612 TaxID=3094835 RepID=UPI003FCDA56C